MVSLEFLSPRLRELLRRLAKGDRRDELQELAWLIENYAFGRLRDAGDTSAIPRVRIEGLPGPVHLVQSVIVRPVPPGDASADLSHGASDKSE